MEPSIDVLAPTAVLARAVLKVQLEKLRLAEVAARAAGADAAVHDMRVATRRVRAALRVFGEHLPARRSVHLGQELRWLGAALGGVRDLDVMAGTLRAWRADIPPAHRVGWDSLVALVGAERERMHRALLRALDSRRYSRLLDGLAELIERPLRARDRLPKACIARAAPGLLERQYERFWKLASHAHPRSDRADRLHALRIRAKRVRYALEFHEAALSHRCATMVPALVALQDLLGAHQDAVVAQTRLHALATAAPAPAPALRRALLTAVERLRAEATEARRTAPEALHRVRPAAWRRARRVWSHLD